MRTLFTLALLAVFAAVAWLCLAALWPLAPPGQKFVLLRPGYSTRRIANELEAAGVIRNSYAFVAWHYLRSKRSLKAGEYLFSRPANMHEVYSRLQRGDIYVHTVVVPEGYNMFDIAQAVQAAGLGAGKDFLQVAMHDTALIADLDPDAKSLEGFLFPNTYEFTRTQSMRDIATTMVKQFRQVAKEIGLFANVGEVVTLASIIEKETSNPEERPLVASVYYNRLGKRIALQADPSVIYAELLQGAYTGALHHDDMRFKSDYNTYIRPGLPPGPIGNPGRSSLQAALHPATSDYYYFVSNGNNQHRFARSLEEHNRNVAAFRKVVTSRAGATKR